MLKKRTVYMAAVLSLFAALPALAAVTPITEYKETYGSSDTPTGQIMGILYVIITVDANQRLNIPARTLFLMVRLVMVSMKAVSVPRDMFYLRQSRMVLSCQIR